MLRPNCHTNLCTISCTRCCNNLILNRFFDMFWQAVVIGVRWIIKTLNPLCKKKYGDLYAISDTCSTSLLNPGSLYSLYLFLSHLIPNEIAHSRVDQRKWAVGDEKDSFSILLELCKVLEQRIAIVKKACRVLKKNTHFFVFSLVGLKSTNNCQKRRF
jgi:hypothetical protein